jgi:sporulation protein YlmC with PRC-barrel domain
MRQIKTLALLGPCLAFALSGPAMAQSMPSTPEEQAQTRALNQGISLANEAAAAKAAEQQAEFRAREQQYENEAARYQAQRDRYAAERTKYRRAAFPPRYRDLPIVAESDLLGMRVRTASGINVGTVSDTSHNPSRQVDAVRVSLNSGGHAWIDADDLRLSRSENFVITNLSRNDLRQMALERY